MIYKKRSPRVSVCIATFNEGPDLEATIALVYASKYKPHEVIVVDDNSEIDPVQRLSAFKLQDNFRYVRHERRRGSGATKNTATSLATGDLIIVLDSHMRPYYEWLNQIVQAHLTHPNALLCTESVGFQQPNNAQFYGRGAYFATDYLKHGAHTVQWCPSEHIDKEPYPLIHAMHGGCYIFPEYQLKRMGGYAPMLKGWGYEEEWIAMRAAAYGIDTRLISGCPVPHQYERSLHRRPAVCEGKPQGWEPFYNRHAVAIMAFGWQKWETIYKNHIINGSDINMRHLSLQEINAARVDLADYRNRFGRETLPVAHWMDRLNLTYPAPVELDEYGIPPVKDEQTPFSAPQSRFNPQLIHTDPPKIG